MANVTFRKGIEVNLPTSGMAEEGCLYMSTDTGNMYYGDANGALVPFKRTPYYGTCPTASATNSKVVTLDVDDDNFSLYAGVMINVRFANGNTVAAPTLNVNGTGAVAAKGYGTTAVGGTEATSWHAGEVVTFVYDGSYWMRVGYDTSLSELVTEGNGLAIGNDGKLSMSTVVASTDGAGGSNGAMTAADKERLDKIADADSVYHAGGNVVVRPLPQMDGYKRLESAYNSASTYINTGFAGRATEELEFELRYRPTTRDYTRLFGAMTGSYARYYLGIISNNSYAFTFHMRDDDSGYIQSSVEQVAGHIYTLRGTMADGVATFFVRDETTGEEDLKSAEYTPTSSTAVNIQMLHNAYADTYHAAGAHIYHAVYRREGKTVLEYVPMQRSSDSAVGFLNTVDGSFVVAAAGSFNAGDTMTNVKDYVVSVPDIPTSTSDLANDGSDGTSTYVEADELASVATSGSYNDLTDTPTIPDSTSDLTNDSGFITSADIPDYTVVKLATAETGYTASYVLRKDGVQTGATINIPKDYLVRSGSVETVTTANVPYQGAAVGDKYLDFVVNTADSGGTTEHIYIPVNDLVDVYTAGDGIAISNANAVSVAIDSNNANGLHLSSRGLALYLADGDEDVTGAMSGFDKKKLDNIEDGAQVNVQSDWSQRDTTADDYIKNKPSIPTVGTLNTNNSTAQTVSSSESFGGAIMLHKVSKTGSYDDLLNKPTIPDSTSDLTNDSGFITSASVPSPADAAPLMDGTAAVGTSTDYAREDHVHPTDTSRVPTTRTVNGKALSSNITLDASDVGALPANTPIPENTSDLTNDSGFITSSALSGLASDTDVVHKAGTETITGNKTFNGGVNLVGNSSTGYFGEISSPLATVHAVEMSMGQPTTIDGNEVAIITMYDDQNVDNGGTVIVRGVNTPISNTDAVNKAYVDGVAGGITSSLADVATSGSYTDLTDTPTIPTVNNGTLTIKRNGTAVATFTANQSTASEADIAVDDVSLVGDTVVVGDGESSGDTTTELTREIANVGFTAGGQWSGKGGATVESLQGYGCAAFNQMVVNGDFSKWDSGRLLPNSWTNGSGFTSTYITASRINAADTDGLRFEAKSDLSSTRYMYCTTDAIVVGHIYLFSLWLRNSRTITIGGVAGGGARLGFSADTDGRWATGRKTMTTAQANGRFAIQFTTGFSAGDYFEIRDLQCFDLTAMFGEGNEPTTAEFFEMFPAFYPRTSKTLLGTSLPRIVSRGYNLYHGGTATLEAGTYVIEGAYTSLSFQPLRNNLDSEVPTPDSGGVFTVSRDGTLTVTGGDGTTCVHKEGDGSRTGYEAFEEDSTAALYGNAELTALFPYGLLAIGSVRDEIVTDADGYARTAIQRIGVRAYVSTDDDDASVVTDGTNTAYVLGTAVETTLATAVKMAYDADGWGVEIAEAQTSDTPSLPVRFVAEYAEEAEAVSKVSVDGDLRNIEDWRIDSIDGTVTAGGNNPVTGAAVASYVGGSGSNVVHRTGSEDINGTKTFYGGLEIGGSVINFAARSASEHEIAFSNGAVQAVGNDDIGVMLFSDADTLDGNAILRGIHDPVSDYDAANKKYIDDIVGDIETLLASI